VGFKFNRLTEKKSYYKHITFGIMFAFEILDLLKKQYSWTGEKEGAQIMISIKNTLEKLRNLEKERKSLLLEIEELKKTAEAKTFDLENDVNAPSEKLLKALKSMKNNDRKIMRAIAKIEKQKRLSKEEFTKVYNSLWKEGPPVKFQHPDSWERARDYVF
jgi:uncharacterized protein (UPF0335 family)